MGEKETIQCYCKKCENKIIQCYCKECKNEINHEVLCWIHTLRIEPYDDIGISWDNDYQIIKCCGCDEISFKSEKYFSEDDGSQIEIFPESDKYQKKPMKLENIPSEIKSLYLETIRAYNAKCYRLCAAGLRAVIELIWDQIKSNLEKENSDFWNQIKNELKKKNSGLEKESHPTIHWKIQRLADTKYLTEKDADILHELRSMGNEALHESDELTEDDLDSAYEIIEITLRRIFELPEAGKKLIARKSKKTK